MFYSQSIALKAMCYRHEPISNLLSTIVTKPIWYQCDGFPSILRFLMCYGFTLQKQKL